MRIGCDLRVCVKCFFCWRGRWRAAMGPYLCLSSAAPTGLVARH